MRGKTQDGLNDLRLTVNAFYISMRSPSDRISSFSYFSSYFHHSMVEKRNERRNQEVGMRMNGKSVNCCKISVDSYINPSVWIDESTLWGRLFTTSIFHSAFTWPVEWPYV
jgi:hypothetical protein